nr:1,2-dihydroxy-3-keto-5-methylthiopentene dioxygenase 1 [Tanacetum cinerariifolium]
MATDLQAWFMDDVHENPQLPHHCNPAQFVSPHYLSELGVLQWKLNPEKYEDDEELESIRTARGYNYMSHTSAAAGLGSNVLASRIKLLMKLSEL